jgi:hypothetical protein
MCQNKAESKSHLEDGENEPPVLESTRVEKSTFNSVADGSGEGNGSITHSRRI